VADGLCARCHGSTGVSTTAGVPHVAGQRPSYLYAKLRAHPTGRRDDHTMESAVKFLNDDALVKVAAYFASLEPPAAPAADTAKKTTAPADLLTAGKTASAACAGCHGEQGVSGNPSNPGLAGQDAEYLAAAMHAYKDGTRAGETMKLAASGVSDSVIADPAAYYAAQQPRQAKVSKPLTLAEWVQRCDCCHGINGNSTDPRTPAIAAQRVEYLQKAMQACQGGQRRSLVMAAMSGSPTDADVANLAAY
jgi:cytochrome c553